MTAKELLRHLQKERFDRKDTKVYIDLDGDLLPVTGIRLDEKENTVYLIVSEENENE